MRPSVPGWGLPGQASDGEVVTSVAEAGALEEASFVERAGAQHMRVDTL